MYTEQLTLLNAVLILISSVTAILSAIGNVLSVAVSYCGPSAL